MDYKEETKKTYDSFPEDFDKKFENSFWQYGQSHADLFLSYLEGKKIVDLGSGPGNHAQYFQKKGLDVLCIDISREMVRLCRQKGLNAKVMDIEDLKLPEKEFDGVCAYASILHIPKEHIPKVVEGIVRILKPKGFLALAVKEGKQEGFKTKEEHPNTRRWFTYFTDKEVREIFSQYFDLISFSKDQIFLHYIFRLKI